jgi:deoxyribonuclease V
MMGMEIPDLRKAALELLLQVPKGKVTTYRALAIALGDPIASRAVGQIMAANEQPDRYPCYKVVHSDGRVGAYSAPGGEAAKIARLQAEGIPVRDGKILNLKEHVFYSFRSEKPLVKLKKLQEELSERVRRTPLRGDYQTVGGVDLSYPDPWTGIGAYVLMDLAGGRPLATEVAHCEISFPYIPTYLAFRELPVLLPLLEQVKEQGKLADVVLVDGSGILHPRHVGIASHLGVLLNTPTVGVTKSLLYGQVDLEDMEPKEVRSVIDPQSGEVIGAAIKTQERAEPIFVSIGHGIDLEAATSLVLRLCSKRLPEPIRRAHLASKEAAYPAEPQGQKALEL